MDVQSVNSGDTAWMLVASALVLLMTPGLAFFYAGMVRAKNVVSTLFQSFSAVAVVGVLWPIIGYSLVFSGDNGGMIGNLDWAFLNHVGLNPNPGFGPTIPHVLFMAFQMMFAVITPALITGSFAERINFKAWVPFMALWVLFVYCPIAHWVWGTDGWIAKLGGLDFAGGLVVHMSAGFSALVASVFLGRRHDFGQPVKGYNIALVALGTALLLVGWFGFNAGSALSAGPIAAQAFATTFFGCAGAFFMWMLVDWVLDKPTLVGSSVGAVAGLVAITPAAGYVTVASALLIGFSAGIVCNFSVRIFKSKFHVVDDTLDVFACHGIGGLLGTVMTGIFASKEVNPSIAANGLFYGDSKVFVANLTAAAAVAVFSIVGSAIVFAAVRAVVPLRVPREMEERGLDTLHGEEILSFDEVYEAKRFKGFYDVPARPL